MIEADGHEWITAHEAPEWLGPDITADRIRDWARRNLITGHRIGRHTYYRLDQLTDIEHKTRTSTRGNKRGVAQPRRTHVAC